MIRFFSFHVTKNRVKRRFVSVNVRQYRDFHSSSQAQVLAQFPETGSV
jgi:hypothetical protein